MGTPRPAHAWPAGALAVLASVCPASGCAPEAAPYGQALVVVDTDLPVDAFRTRLRVDVFDEQGWFETRDVAASDPRAWPLTFAVFDSRGRAGVDVRVRLRAYPAGRLRDYRGERFADASATAPPPPSDGPRCIRSGEDVTPSTEPSPELAVDRLVAVHLADGSTSRVPIVLRGACIGTMADLARGASCVDTEQARVPIEAAPADPDVAEVPSRSVGRFGAPVPCAERVPARPRGAPLFQDEVCVPGGAYIFGGGDELTSVDAQHPTLEGLPERLAVVAPFRVDAFEVTVARWRSAVSAGFVSPDATPLVNDGPLGETANPSAVELATMTSRPGDREAYPVDMVSRAAARAFCQFDGGDLPSEAQWEYLAGVVGRPRKTLFPWGDAAPSCDDVVFARVGNASTPSTVCWRLGKPVGPGRVDAAASTDRVALLGVVGLGGGLREWMRDAARPLDAPCWRRAPLRDPVCSEASSDDWSVRGGAWTDEAVATSVTRYVSSRAGSANVGFRCVRSVE